MLRCFSIHQTQQGRPRADAQASRQIQELVKLISYLVVKNFSIRKSEADSSVFFFFFFFFPHHAKAASPISAAIF